MKALSDCSFEHVKSNSMGNLNKAEVESLALRLALLVARMGSNDSAKWWDDHSLTHAGKFVLNKLFPRTWQQASYKLALQAAKERHYGAIRAAGYRNFITIFNIAYSHDDLALTVNGVGDSAALNIDDFKVALRSLCPDLEQLEAPLPFESGVMDITDLLGEKGLNTSGVVAAFASAYLRAETPKPVFPFIRTGEQ